MTGERKFRTVRGYQLQKRDKGRMLTPSMEDYLEMIYRNCKQEQVDFTRVNVLAEQLNVQAPSVSRVIRRLAEAGYVNYRKYGTIKLTASGKKLGQYLLARHEIIEQFLENVGVVNNLLVETELIEHYLSPDTVWKLDSWNKYLAKNPDILLNVDEFRLKYYTEE